MPQVFEQSLFLFVQKYGGETSFPLMLFFFCNQADYESDLRRYLLKGTKRWVTGATDADIFLVKKAIIFPYFFHLKKMGGGNGF